MESRMVYVGTNSIEIKTIGTEIIRDNGKFGASLANNDTIWFDTEQQAVSFIDESLKNGFSVTSDGNVSQRYSYKPLSWMDNFIKQSKNTKKMSSRYDGKDIYGNKFKAGTEIYYHPKGVIIA